MKKFVRNVLLSCWKNWICIRRKYVSFTIELIFPIIIPIAIMVFVRYEIPAQNDNTTTSWESFSPDGGELFLQNASIGYTPPSIKNDEIMKRLGKVLKMRPVPFNDEKKMETSSMNWEANRWYAGIVFIDDVANKKIVHYKIRMPNRLRVMTFGSASWKTNSMQARQIVSLRPRSLTEKTGGVPNYWREEFLKLQWAIDNEIVGSKMELDELQRIDYPPFNDDKIANLLSNQLPFIFTLSYIFIVIFATRLITMEKESGIRELMKLHGLTRAQQWIAWSIRLFSLMIISCVIITIFYKIKIPYKDTKFPSSEILRFSSGSCFFVFLLLHSLLSITFVLLLGTIFNKGYTGALGGAIIWFLSYVPYTFVQGKELPLIARFFMGLLPNIPISFGTELLSQFEGRSEGLHWSNITKDYLESYRFIYIFFFMIFDFFFYLLLAIYIDDINPGEFGVPKPWYYPFTCCFTTCQKNQYESVTDITEFASENGSDVLEMNEMNEMFETKSIKDKKTIVDIIKLRKVFRAKGDQGNVVAVDNLNMKIHENEITAFLGHNGAGKSTTINILTGIMKATSGSIIFNSTDIVKYPNEIRNSIGLCQQKNILFDYMTVDEHLYFFARLKNASNVQEEKDKYLKELGLEEKHSAQSKTLSGGQKRRLCIGIAFCGNSSLVILDEPTAGVDPSARREIWNILRSNKTGRTILLTTHFMDEADLLGDRIGIMVDGRLQCFGSSMFLKSRYGLGYRLTCSLKDKNNVGEQMSKQVIEWLRKEGGMKESSIITAIGNEMSFRLPKEGSFDGRLSAMLKLLDTKKEDFFIDKCGLSITTLEEVFLRAVKAQPKHAEESDNDEIDDGFNVSSRLIDRYVKKDYRVLSGMAKRVQQARGLFQKIYYGNIRRWRFAIVQILIPVFFTIMSIVSTKIIKSTTKEIPLLMGPGTYKAEIFPYQFTEQFTNETKLTVKNCIEKTLSEMTSNDGVPLNYLMAHNIEDPFPDNSPFKKCGGLKNFREYALCFGNKFGTYQYIASHVIGMTIGKKSDKLMVKGLFQDFYYHSASYSWNTVQNFRHNWLEGNGTLVRVYNHPLPLTVDDRKDKRSNILETIESFLVATNLLMGFAFLFASFTAYIVNEKNSKAKHLQYISGIGSFFYWGTHMIWNFFQYLIIIVLVVILVKVGDIRSFSDNISRSTEIFLLLLLYGPGELCLMYLLCQFFKKSATSVASLTVFNLLSGIIPVTVVYIIQLVDDTGNIADYLNWVFMIIFPSHALGMALLNYGVLYSQKLLCEFLPMLPACSIGYLSFNKAAIGRNIVVLAGDAVLYSAILFFVESDILNRFNQFILRKFHSNTNQLNTVRGDDDVIKMREKIMNMNIYGAINEDLPPIVVKGLSKKFGRNMMAVNPLYFQCEYGECFGLLGANGAGKTTTFDMLTGILYPTNGTAFIVSHDIQKNLKNVQKNIGYCPQFDALCEMMTGKELLNFYGRLRGIANEDLSVYTTLLLQMFNIERYANTIATNYSGGNKRKLSTAISLVGNSKVLFLDEPTTGMDVAARRYLWTVVNKLRDTQEHTLVLTSHSMEECEALCTTAAIMINGQFKCLNSIQNLKSIYGEGVTISVKVAEGDDLEVLEEKTQQKFGKENMICLNKCDKIAEYQIKTTDTSLSSMADIFDYMSENKKQLNIDDFYVNQTTLEQIFNAFAKEQTETN